MSASEELSSGFTAMEHLSCDSVSLPQASTYIERNRDVSTEEQHERNFECMLSSPVRQGELVPVRSVLM